MPRKTKKGGAFAYTDQFNYPLSPCYRPNGKDEIPKMGWHAGGSEQKQMFSDTPSEKELSQKYLCEPELHKIAGGSKVLATIDALKRNKRYIIRICEGNKYDLNIEEVSGNRRSNKKCKNMKELRDELNKFSINNYEMKNN
jgi:hypothetical protein